MNKHKTKLFKSVFQHHCESIHLNKKDEIEFIREDVFVPILGDMWRRAKEKYRKRNERDAIAFAQWYKDEAYSLTYKTIEESYILWKSQKS